MSQGNNEANGQFTCITGRFRDIQRNWVSSFQEMGISNNVPRDLGMQFPGNWGKLLPGACGRSLAREWGRQFSRE